MQDNEFFKLKQIISSVFKKDTEVKDIKNKVLVFNLDTEKVRFIDKTEKTISGDIIVYSNEKINSIINNNEIYR